MQDSFKNPLQSMTVWGAVLMLFAWLKTKYGWDATESQLESYATIGLPIVLTVIGRFRATSRVTMTGAPAALLVCTLVVAGCGVFDGKQAKTTTAAPVTAQAAETVGRTQGQSVAFVFADQQLLWDIRFPEDVLDDLTDEQKQNRDARGEKALLLIETAMDKFALDDTATNAERLKMMIAMQEFAKGVGTATGSLVTVSLDHAQISNNGDAAGLGGEGGTPAEDDPEKPDADGL